MRLSIQKEKLGVIGLVIVALLWGAGFPAIEFANRSITPLYQIAFRFLIASLVMSILFFKKLSLANKEIIKTAVLLSLPLFLLYFFSAVGIKNTTVSKASFYCCIAVVIVPLFSRVLLKTHISKKSIACIALCTLGISLISFNGDGGYSLNFGDLLCIISSMAAALHVVLTEKYLTDYDATLLVTLQMYSVTILAGFTALMLEPLPEKMLSVSIYALFFMGILCTSFAYWIQTNCQKFISSNRVAMIFSLEPALGAAITWLVLGESLRPIGILGGIIIVSSLLLSELNIELNIENIKKAKSNV